MNVTRDQLKGIVVNIWGSVLSLPIDPIDGEHAIDGASLTGCVHITGSWSGALVIAMTQEATRQAAAAMFGMQPEEVGDGEMRDALGELVNIAGGNFKGQLPSGCQLSLPTVVEGEKYTMVVANSKQVEQHGFVCAGQAVQIKVLEREQ